MPFRKRPFCKTSAILCTNGLTRRCCQMSHQTTLELSAELFAALQAQPGEAATDPVHWVTDHLRETLTPSIPGGALMVEEESAMHQIGAQRLPLGTNHLLEKVL